MNSLSSAEVLSDRALADLIDSVGSEEAFRMLYRRHTPALHGAVVRRIRTESVDPADIIQDTWLRVVQSLGSFRWRSSFRTWLVSIGLNRVRELERKHLRRKTETREVVDRPVQAPDVDTSIDLQRALAELPQGYRTVLTMHDLEGHTHPEISEKLQIAVGTSRSQLFNARRVMRRLLMRGNTRDE